MPFRRSKIAGAKSIADLKNAKLGAQVGTTSYQAITDLIKPSTQPQVFNNNDDAKAALSNGQIDALVLDLPTAFEVQSELTDGVIVGQLPNGTEKPEQFGIVLDKGSPLTRCVSKAVDDLTKAMKAADRAQLEALTADGLSYGHSAGKVETKKEFIDVIADKKTIYKSITLSDPTVSVVGNNAIARHTFAAEVEANGQASSPKIGVMQVWVKDGGAWKLLARQAFRI